MKNSNSPPKELIAVSNNGFKVYSRYGIRLDKHVTLAMVKEVIEGSYLYQDMERISSLITYGLSGKGHKRRLIVALIKYKDSYEVSKAFWKRNLKFIGHAKNLYPVYFARDFYCNINSDFLRKVVSNSKLESKIENYRVKTKAIIGYVDFSSLSFYEDVDDLMKVVRHGKKHPVYMAFSSPQKIQRLSIDFEKKSDIDGIFYVITNIKFTGLEPLPRPWELDPEDDLYLVAMKFWQKHAYCFMPEKIRKNITSS